MRQLKTAGLAATVALALGAMAHASTAQAVTMFSKTVPRLTGPANAAPASSTTTGTTTTTTTTPTPQNTTNVDLRAQQNQQAVAGTFASGSTSALGPLAGSSTLVSGPFGSGTTSGAGATGTTGTTGNAAGGALGAPTIVGFAALGTSTNGGLVVAPITALPSDLTAGSAIANTTLASATPTFTNADIAGASLAQNGIVVTERADSRSFDRAVDMVKRDRLRAGRNGQLVYSVAPRTNVDRTWQMPDDGPGPSLTGSNSTLTR